VHRATPFGGNTPESTVSGFFPGLSLAIITVA
jgi:hypothetical protein